MQSLLQTLRGQEHISIGVLAEDEHLPRAMQLGQRRAALKALGGLLKLGKNGRQPQRDHRRGPGATRAAPEVSVELKSGELRGALQTTAWVSDI